jgi:hypothetical protein
MKEIARHEVDSDWLLLSQRSTVIGRFVVNKEKVKNFSFFFNLNSKVQWQI